tara:strand:- start:93 stop:770 length:678 start_codon:yes stop_codon:yes gene_type:complete
MINLTDLIYVERNLISPDECDIMIEENEYEKTYREKSTNINLIHQQSGGKTCDVNPNDKSIELANKYTTITILNYYKYLKSFDYFLVEELISSFLFAHNYRFIRYQCGDKFHTHIDWTKHGYYTGSCTLNLSENYDGGEFTFFNQNYDIKLNKGDTLIFPASSFFTHGVKEITSGVRYCINSFLSPSTRDFDNKFINANKAMKVKYKHNIESEIKKKYNLAKLKS